MPSSIDAGLLRTLTPNKRPSELHRLRSILSDDEITHQLLDATERGSLSTPVFAAWFGVCKTPVLIRLSLTQKSSVHIRLLGIKQLRRGLRSAQWQELWDGLGGTVGLLEILSDLSVLEVKTACKAIGRCVRAGDVGKKQERVTELFKGLHPDIFPNVAAKTSDLRPLTKFYQALIPSCTSELVDWITAPHQEGRWQYVREGELLEHHADNVGRAAFETVFENRSSDSKGKNRLKKLSTQFPATTSTEPRLSTSMTFALSLLRTIVETDAKVVEDEWVLDNLIRPLLRRAIRKRVSWSRTQEIIALSVELIEQCRSGRQLLTNDKGDVLHMVALCWSRRSTLFEAHLRHLLNVVFTGKTRFQDIENLLGGIPRSRRYALLHLCCQETMKIDLDSERMLPLARGVLTTAILNSIEAAEALELFNRLRRVRGDVGLVDLGQYESVPVTTRTPDDYEGDPDVHYLVLLNRNGLYEEAEVYAAPILEARKKATRTSSNREKRAELAVSVWACASASGSLRLLSETVEWARSFVRDQLTASKIFSTYYYETYWLLSGFLSHSNDSLKPHDLRRRVEHANTIIMNLLDVAYSAQREPFFKCGDWRQTLEVFTRVIEQRVKLSADAKKEMGVSDSGLYDALWDDTVSTLVRAERLINSEDYKKLETSTIATFGGLASDSDSKTGDVATWTFLDNLAKARDHLWGELRPARFPDVLTLPEPFPRGLPVQQLVPSWSPNVENLDELAPYIASRVKATLFADSEAALKPVPGDKKTGQAIGVFVNSYQWALRAHIPKVCDDEEKKRRLEEVWQHATGPLSDRYINGRHIEPEEAVRLWKQSIPQQLHSTLSNLLPKKERRQWPVVPTSDKPTETQEWNPLEGRPADVKIKARGLGKATYIDLSTLGAQAKHTKSDLKPNYQLPSPQIPSKNASVGSIWGVRTRTSTERENEALAAMLYLDAKYSSGQRLLTTPFPSTDDVRYSCIYLDEEFLLDDDLHAENAASFISSYHRDIPPQLVHKIAATLVERLDHKDSPHAVQHAAFTLLRALSESDRPGLAFALAIRVIVGQPSASSWHRMLFSNGFLQRIPASDAKKCISTYAEAIGKKLDAQKLDAQMRAEVEQGADTNLDKPTTAFRADDQQQIQPFIKVTTLKSLAQILHGSTYIGDDASLEILSSLAKKITHIDVRLSILKTLLSKLDANRPELWDRVLSTLEPFIPLAGSLNEREAMVEDGWTKEAALLTLPEVQLTTKRGWQEESPMLDAILNQYVRRDNDGDLLGLYSKRIIFPTLDALKQNTAKWTNLFLSKYASDDATVLNVELPPVPRGITMFEQILTKPQIKAHLIPQALLDEYVAYLLFRIHPSKSIRDLNNRLLSDPAVKSRSEVQTWLNLYGNKVDAVSMRRLPFTSIEHYPEELLDGNSYVTRRSFQQSWLEVFTTLLWVGDTTYAQLQAWSSTLTYSDTQLNSWWLNYGKTTIEVMLAKVDSIRTREWEADPHRKPAVLPLTFHWKLALLSYPFNSFAEGDEEVREQTCKVFASELATILDSISNTMYHAKLAQIKDHICARRSTRNDNFKSNLLLTALYLGDISRTRLSWLTTPELLRVDMAADIMCAVESLMLHDQNIRFDYESLMPRVRRLLSTWIASENEEVRRKGYWVRSAFNCEVVNRKDEQW